MPTPDSDVDHRAEQLKRNLAKAKSTRWLAWEALKHGANPKYVAMRYGFDEEELRVAIEKWRAKQEAEMSRREVCRG